mmetsp:Transcript_53271/g.98489  ORF Transcript_53271/g.98489 Transcript_53271/m.98489 type:complete len:587 (-) Transcript_53271:63-1823(-)
MSRPAKDDDHRPAPLAKPVAPPIINPPLVDIIFEDETGESLGLEVAPEKDDERGDVAATSWPPKEFARPSGGRLAANATFEGSRGIVTNSMGLGLPGITESQGLGRLKETPDITFGDVLAGATSQPAVAPDGSSHVATLSGGGTVSQHTERGVSQHSQEEKRAPSLTSPTLPTHVDGADVTASHNGGARNGHGPQEVGGASGGLQGWHGGGSHPPSQIHSPERLGSRVSGFSSVAGSHRRIVPSRQGSAASSLERMRSWLSKPSSGERRMSGMTILSLRRTFETTPGHLLDHYSVHQKLGSGAFGEVMVAISKSSGERVAVKSIPLMQARIFEREYEIARRLKHPFIVKLLDMFKDLPGDAAKCHLCIELCTGGDLMSFVRAHEERTFAGVVYTPPRTENVAQYIWQSISGIDYLHHHCIAHRDIKAENYLRVARSEASKIKLIDFGLSEHFPPGRRMHDRVGTLGYCAPETMVPGPQGYTELCDIWSAGILFYLLFVGEFPISIPKGCSMRDASRITIETDIVFHIGAWRAHPPEAMQFVKDLLSKDVNERPTAKRLLMNTWLRSIGRSFNDEKEGTSCCGCLRV